MIISCEKCNKKFDISDDLIPVKGRILQCGSCSHKWHFIPIEEQKSDKEIESIKNNEEEPIKELVNEKEINNKVNLKKDKKVGFLSYLLVFIISFIALVVIAETFEPLISSYIPEFDFYLFSLKESLKDIFLFFKNLIK